jgi:hypothetical protein
MPAAFACLFLFVATALCAPWWTEIGPDPRLDAVLGAGAAAEWDMTGPFSIEDDPLLGRPALECGAKALTLTARPVYQNVRISALVRLATDEQRKSSSCRLALTDPADPKQNSQVLITGTYNGNLALSAAGTRANYDLRAYDTMLPTWPDAVRIPIERDMKSLPLSQDKWVRLRVEFGNDRLRVWVDDRLLANETENLPARGKLQLALQPGARVAEVAVHPLAPVPALFEPISLDGYVRDRALLGTAAVADGALPCGQTVTVEGVPFRFADRRSKADPDHLDLSRSLVRQGAMKGYFPTSTPRYSGSFTVDPARIQFRVPNARYDALYVVAGFDGGKDRIPNLSALFYRPGAGFAQSFEARVPAVTAKTADAKPLPVKLENGKSANLWLVKIPLDPALLNSFSDMDIVEIELTKKVYQYRSYPDPFLYGWHGAGLPSGVRVYAVTLHKTELDFNLAPAAFGHVWTDPETPGYDVQLTNNTAQAKKVTVRTTATSYDKGETANQEKTVEVPAGGQVKLALTFPVKKNGIHQLAVTLQDGDSTWTETRYFCRLAKDTRAAEWMAGDGPEFGYWSYHGGHYTPPKEEIQRVMRLAGARAPHHPASAWPLRPQWDWAGADPVDREKYDAFKQTAVESFRKTQGDNPEYVTFFPEPHLSRELTAGHPPDYWGEPEYQLNEKEQLALKVFMTTSRAAAEGIRAAWPNTKILIPWGDPLFAVPFLRAGFPKELIDGSGLDMIGFERLPEQQIHQMSTHRLYILKEEFKKFGLDNPMLSYIEGIFSPTEPGALTWQEQAERYHRWTLLSMAYGIERFHAGWFAFDCGDYYGAEHYGGCGIQRRIPYADPKPAYAHFATMTRHLERAKFEKWIPTGSNTVYCLQFRKDGKPLYALWTVRGTRPVTLDLGAVINGIEVAQTVTVTDGMDNGTELKTQGGKVTFTVGESPVYVTGAGQIIAVAVGKPDHSDAMQWARNRNQQTWHDGPAVKAPPVGKEITLAGFGDGSWTLAAERDETYENNNYDTKRFPGKMSAKVTADLERPGSHLAIHLEQQEKERKLMPWYTVLKPKAPLEIPGKADALGVWVKANSDWGRVIYSLRDANGERWISIGAKDDWNCNDVHGWSMFAFDGWRYLRFELPASAPYDAYREYGTTWWGSYAGDGIVDLPLKLEKVIIERRTHVIYVNDIQPANPADVLLGELIAEYETPADATREAVRLNHLRIPLFAAGDQANPIAEMAKNAPAPVRLLGVKDPDWGYDGTRAHVNFTETPDAARYEVWVAAQPDGRGAVALGRGTKSGFLVENLRPAMKLYLWVTYTTPDSAVSKPSNRLEIELVDAFSQK